MKFKIGGRVIYDGKPWIVKRYIPDGQGGCVYLLQRGDFSTIAKEEELTE